MSRDISLSLRKYRSLTCSGIIEALNFRMSYFVTVIGNLVYLIIIYFLWRAIYASSPMDIVNGMTFTDTMVYLVIATALCNFFEVYIVWIVGNDIQTGKIILNLIKPMNFQVYTFFYFAGSYLIMFLFTFIPTLLLVYFLTGGAIVLGINLLFFLISLLFGLIINYCIDFFVATICLYTQSIWGINIMKEAIVLFVSGATVPLAFFPKQIKTIIDYLPFKSIYNTPLMILVDNSLNVMDYFYMLLVQVFWLIIVVIISNLFWRKSLKAITVNGG